MTAPECLSCHTTDGRPHTEYCPDRYRGDPVTRHDAAIIQAALDTIPATCRYHGDDLEWGLRREPCCDTGKPSLARRKAEAALKRSEPR